MANYAEVINNNGSVTIDDTTARLVKTRTVSITASATTVPDADLYWIQSGDVDNKYVLKTYCHQRISLNSNEKIVAIRAKAQHDNVAVLGGFVSATQYQVTLMGTRTNTNLYQSDYLVDIYGNVPSSGGTNSGLEIFNASGTKIFDSDFYAMDVSSVFNVFDKQLQDFKESATSYSMGGYSIDGHAVVINTCINKPAFHPRIHQMGPAFSVVYGAVFGSSIYLEKRVSEYITFLWQGGDVTPHGYSHSSSGIILNTKNI